MTDADITHAIRRARDDMTPGHWQDWNQHARRAMNRALRVFLNTPLSVTVAVRRALNWWAYVAGYGGDVDLERLHRKLVYRLKQAEECAADNG